MEKKYRRAYLGGTWDLPHVGHVRLVKKALSLADEVVLSFNTDEFTTRFKRKPVMNLYERMTFWWELKGESFWSQGDNLILWVNWKDEDSRPAILASNSDVIIHGNDWKGGRPAYLKQLGIPDEQWLLDNKISLEFVQYDQTISTTEIIRRIKQ